MTSFLGYRRARRDCFILAHQRERAQRIASLPIVYHQALTAFDTTVLSTPISKLVQNVQSGAWDPLDILRSYGKKALQAQEATNCLTEVMISDAEYWARSSNKTGPLAGVPVSLKDSLAVKGYDASIGYSSWVGKPVETESALVKLLRDAGAVPYVKTTIPITLLSFESQSAVFGVTKNPHVPTHTPGGSSGGEAALIAYGGSRIGVGTDVAGSVRIPAHFSGIYAIRSSTGRFPKTGGGTSIAGQEGVPATLGDLETFWKAVVSMKPWEYDHSDKKLTWGVIWDDGVIPPSPACERTLRTVVNALQRDGHNIVEFDPPSLYEGLKLASQLLLADGGEIMMRPFQFREPNDPFVHMVRRILLLPRILRTMYSWYLRYIRRDPITAGLVKVISRKTTVEQFGLVAQREGYRAKFHEAMKNAGVDFLLTVPNAMPALPLGGMKNSAGSIGYSFIFNLLDYTAGVLPVSKVDAAIDNVSPSFKSELKNLNKLARMAYRNYDSKAMHGLPIGVQVVGRRLEEEKVLEGMKIVESVISASGQEYKPLEV
ncbi:amidase signature enzyme [Ramaria rubella]|nr:amidase signature enzyme [Ramaria rubella]